MPEHDPKIHTSCGIGRMFDPSQKKTYPVFVADHGHNVQSLYPIASSYKKLELSITRRDSGKWCFWVASDERTPGTDNPELSVMYDTSDEVRGRFLKTQENSDGAWLLFLVSVDVTRLTIASDGTVTDCECFPLEAIGL